MLREAQQRLLEVQDYGARVVCFKNTLDYNLKRLIITEIRVVNAKIRRSRVDRNRLNLQCYRALVKTHISEPPLLNLSKR